MTLIVKDGLRFRSGRFRPLPLHARSAAAPRFWRAVAPAGRSAPASEPRLAQWTLVLTAKNIPFVLARRGGRRLIYVPPLAEGVARHELTGYAAEPTIRPAPVEPLLRFNPLPPGLFFLLLALWHGICTQAIALPWLPPLSAQEWTRLGALDVYRVSILHEWYRTATALTLHADAVHLVGNLTAGFLFLGLLSRRAGFGPALLLTVLGGIIGNACNVVYRPYTFSSLGFSTALFAALGALSGIQALREGARERRKALLPLGGGAGLLAMLGTEGAHTDYAAHLFGMGAGLVLGAALQYRADGRLSARRRQAAALAAYALFIVAWSLALQ